MEDRTFVEWDKDDIDTLGLMKVDVLALGMLSCLHRGLDLLKAHYGKDYSLAMLPQDDPAVYEMLSRADSVGAFQVEAARKCRAAAIKAALLLRSVFIEVGDSAALARSRATWCIPISPARRHR